MANAIYPKAKEVLLQGSINMSSDTIKAVLVNTSTDYTYSSTHQYLSSVTTYSGVTAQTLGTKTFTNGVFDAADITFTAVAVSGSKAVNAIIIYKDTGSAATSNLIAYLDTSYTNLPVTPNGGDITITWDNGTNKIFAL